MKIGEEEKINAIKLDAYENFSNITIEELEKFLHFLTQEEQDAKGFVWQPYEIAKDCLYLGTQETYQQFQNRKAILLQAFFNQKGFLLRNEKYKKGEV